MACEDKPVWDSFIEIIGSVIKQVQEGEGCSGDLEEFDYKSFWKKLGDVFKAVSHEATKIALAYSKPPRPSKEECEGIIKSAKKPLQLIVQVYCNLPKAAGLTWRKKTKLSVLQLLDAVNTLALDIRKYESGSSDRCRSTGIVWQESDLFLTLPQDNKAAVLQLLDEHIPMVDDAHSELTEALNCDDDDDGLDEFLGLTERGGATIENSQRWTEADKDAIQYCLGMIKCSKSLLKKCRVAVQENGNCESETNIAQLDDLAEYLERLSPAADDLASSVYPPLRREVVQVKAGEVAQANKDMITFLRQSHLTKPDDQKWVEFLNKANTHNKNKLTSALSKT